MRPHRETVAPVIRILRDPEMENLGGTLIRADAARQPYARQPKSFEIVGLGDMPSRQNEPDDKQRQYEIQGG
jgi:hypothetical protein